MRLRQRPSPIPFLNLTPMLDVMMSVLTFFIAVALSLTLEKFVEFRLPDDRYPVPSEATPFLVDVGSEEITVNDRSVSQADLVIQAQTYLQANPTGFVLLRPQPSIPYQDIVDILIALKKVGGDRISLVVYQEEE